MSEREVAPMEPFDPATMPLEGIRLIEASAGTGKTFSLAGLYLRLIVERGLDVQDILVMTFTRAATQELRERLRASLAKAARVAAEPPDEQRTDAGARFAESVIAGVDEDRTSVARRLREAATRADQATITTIHGFAQRAAAENAFESALPFDRGEQVEDREVHREASTDYWRTRAFTADVQRAQAFLALWSSPDALRRELGEPLAKPHAALARPDYDALEQLHQEALTRWPTERGALAECLTQGLEGGAFRNTKHDKYSNSLRVQLETDGIDGWLDHIDRGLKGTVDGFPALPALLADFRSDEGLNKHATKTGRKWFRPQDIGIVPLLARLQVDGRLAAAIHAIDGIRALAARRKTEKRQYSFDDMIAALHAAVTDPRRGRDLTQAIRRTWPWALVDEFQDTDPLQYAILKEVYRPDAAIAVDHDERGGGLTLIGDPKQAIYAFRGGDVFAYLDAARDADGRYGMETNHRSTPAVVDGLDALFSAGGDRTFVIEDIQFLPVKAARTAGDRQVTLAANPIPGVTAWSIPADAPSKKDHIEARIRNAVVDRVSALLATGQMAHSTNEERSMLPGDVAVLVNTNQQAGDMQRELARACVPAVCVHQTSVFASEAARDLQWLLQAVATPLDPARLRRALITPLFGLRLGDLVRIEGDEAEWSAWTERFQSAHVDWGRTGVQAMLEPFLQAAAGRVLARTDGERRMTDYLHVAERLQEAEHEVFGREGLVRWLGAAIERAEDGEMADADRIRLEDDSDFVQVTTVHKAKGLQWPVVFVPFAPWLGTGGCKEPTGLPLVFHDADDRSVIDLGSHDADENCPRAVREHKAEQVRSLYVAFTRAEEALFFVHGAANNALDGPLAWVLHHEDGVTAEEWHGRKNLPDWFDAGRAHGRLAELQKTSEGALAVDTLPEVTAPRQLRRSVEGALEPARSDFPARPEPWSIFSFSRLAGRMADAGEEIAGSNDEFGAPPAADSEAQDAAPPSPAVVTWPRGAGFGQAFHEIVESIDFASWPAPGDTVAQGMQQTVTERLRRHGIAAESAGERSPIEETVALVAHTLHAPLPEIGPLAEIPAARRRSELEFFLRLGGASADTLLERIAAAGYGSARRATALPALRGLMHGYIDLVVEHEGRYWLLDYKTNLLGATRADYAPAVLAEAIAAHHYDLQYLIYSVALHRYLRQALTAYDPATHLGGVLYLFVRGLDAEGRHGVFADRPEPRLIESLDALLDGREAAA